MKRGLWAAGFVIIGVWAGSVHAGEMSETLLRQGIVTLREGYNAWDAKAFQKAAADFQAAATANTHSAAAHYWQGVAHLYQAMYFLHGEPWQRDTERGSQAVEAGRRALKTAVDMNPDSSEINALLGVLTGMHISLNVFDALSLGPKVEQYRRRALELNPDNPRVYYLIGVSYYFAPGIFGGGPDAALPYLEKAEALFRREADVPPGPLEPRWGYGTCLSFLGEVYRRRGQPGTARTFYQRALEVNPGEPLARMGLQQLPESSSPEDAP